MAQFIWTHARSCSLLHLTSFRNTRKKKINAALQQSQQSHARHVFTDHYCEMEASFYLAHDFGYLENWQNVKQYD